MQKMKKTLLLSMSVVLLLSGCSSSNNACEDVAVASDQVKQCQSLQRQIVQAKNKPIIRTELERRYEQDCVNLRYYRDDHQGAICGNKEKIQKEIKKIEAEK